MTHFSIRNLSIATALTVGFLAGCTTSKVDEKPAEETVAARAAERWQQMMQLNFDGAYAYLAPSVKTVLSEDGYKRRYSIDPRKKQGPWTSADVKSVTCPDEETCNVSIYIESQADIPQFKGMKTSALIEERWIYQDGKWWLYMK